MIKRILLTLLTLTPLVLVSQINPENQLSSQSLQTVKISTVPQQSSDPQFYAVPIFTNWEVNTQAQFTQLNSNTAIQTLTTNIVLVISFKGTTNYITVPVTLHHILK